MKRLFTLVFAIFFLINCSAQIVATKGTEFWVGFMDNVSLLGNGPPSFSFVISSENNATGTISLPATGYSTSFSVIANQPKEIYLPAGVFYPLDSETIEGKGIKITSDEIINVLAMHYRLYFCESTIVLAVSELGYKYITVTNDDIYGPLNPAAILIVATKDSTEIEITPSGLTYGFRPAGTTFSITLHEGEVYQIKSNEDLTGTLVESVNNKKIAVFSGSKLTTVECPDFTSHTYDQNYPVSRWGTEYAFIPFKAQGGDPIHIVASQDGTTIKFNCGSDITLDEGESYYTVLSSATYITSDKPITVAQFEKGAGCAGTGLGDPNMLILSPVLFRSKFAGFLAPDKLNISGDKHFLTHFVNVLTDSNNINDVYLDGSTIPFSYFTPLPSNSKYYYAQIALSSGFHTLESAGGFQAYSYGFGFANAYTSFLGYEYIIENNDISIIYTGDTCANREIDFTANTTLNVTDWNWSFGDGGNSNVQNPVYSYSQPGTYLVVLSFLSSNGCYQSEYLEITVKDCSNETIGPCSIFIPNVFSPNSDGKNDVLYVRSACPVKELLFIVYNRWGEKVFATEDINTGWDGIYRNRLVNSNVFVYQASGTFTDGSPFDIKGNVTLVR